MAKQKKSSAKKKKPSAKKLTKQQAANKKQYKDLVQKIKRRMREMEKRNYVIDIEKPESSPEKYTKKAIKELEKKYSSESLYKHSKYYYADEDTGEAFEVQGTKGRQMERSIAARKGAETKAKRKKKEEEKKKEEWVENVEDIEDEDEEDYYNDWVDDSDDNYDNDDVLPDTLFGLDAFEDLVDSTIASLSNQPPNMVIGVEAQRRIDYLQDLLDRVKDAADRSPGDASRINGIIEDQWHDIQQCIESDIGNYFGPRGDYVAEKAMAHLDENIFGAGLGLDMMNTYDEDDYYTEF